MRSLRREQLAGLAVVMLGSFVAALDASIVATVMPTVIGELGGIDRYALVFSMYLLVSTVATPVAGRLSDVFGRTPIYIGAMAVFVAGSVGAGLSADMTQLIVARAVQGLGAGALLPVGMTIVGDLFDARGRARIQPVFSTMWLSGALIGPVAGGLLTQTVSWRWAFLVNVPIGAVAIAVLLFVFHEERHHLDERIDWLGAGVLTIASGGLLFALNGLAPVAGWIAALVGYPLFVMVERASAQPLFDLALVRIPAVGAGMALNAIVGVMAFAVSTYLPPFVQGVLGRTPVEAGAVVFATSVGWSSGAVVNAFVLEHLGPRRTALVGTLFWSAGSTLFVSFGADTALPVAVIAAVVFGLGMGLTAFPIVVASQSAVGSARRGVVTSVIQFANNMGASIGVAALGAALLATLDGRASAVQQILDRSQRATLDAATQASLAATLDTGVHSVYLIMVGLSVVGALLATRLPAELSDAS